MCDRITYTETARVGHYEQSGPPQGFTIVVLVLLEDYKCLTAVIAAIARDV